MTLFDLFIAGVLGLSVFFGWWRGLLREIGTLVAIGLGAAAVWVGGAPLSAALGQGWMSAIIILSILFLTGFILGAIVSELVIARLIGARPSALDRIGGGAFGVIRGWFLVGLAFLMVSIYYDEDGLPPSVDNALLKPVAASAAGLLDAIGVAGRNDDPSDLEIGEDLEPL